MLLVLSVILIASVVLYMGFQKVKSTNEKILMVAAYILLIGLVFKYLMTKEGFQVKMEDEEFINNLEELDIEAEEKFNENTTTTKNESNEKDNENVGNSTFNPTLVVNIPDDTEKDGKAQIVLQNPNTNATDPFKPSDELFKSSSKNTEYFKEAEKHSAAGNKVEAFNTNADAKPYVESSVPGARFYTKTDFVPGMAFIPPTEWEIPQPHKTSADCNMVCSQSMPNTRMLPIAMMDHGTPINALELGPDGMIAKREEDAPLTAVGSMLPKFEYREYVNCYKYDQSGSPGVAATST
jgi:hypothetical protein